MADRSSRKQKEPELPNGMWKRGRVYYARFRIRGREIRKRLGTSYDAALDILNELIYTTNKGDFGLVDDDYSWAELKTQFLRWANQSLRRTKGYASDLERFEAFAKSDKAGGLSRVRHITPALVMRYREHRLSQSITVKSRKAAAEALARRVCPRTVNKEVGTLNNLLNLGVKWKLIGRNPIQGLKPLPHDKPVKNRRPLTKEEVDAIFLASPEYLRPVWRMFMCTAIRKVELTELKFSDIDFAERTVCVRAEWAKNRREREIPLDDELLGMLEELKAAARSRRPMPGPTATQTKQQEDNFSRDHVFVSQANTPLRNNLLKRFYAVCKRAGIDDAGRGGGVEHPLAAGYLRDADAAGWRQPEGRAGGARPPNPRDDDEDLCQSYEGW